MTRDFNGLAQFQQHLPAGLMQEVDSWLTHPQLCRLRDSLHAHSDEHTLLNVCAEAMIARYLLQLNCDLRFEVPTPSGKQADFEVTRDGEQFFLHVKRLDTIQPSQTTLTVSSRLRILERIERPYIVSVRWHEPATDSQMQQFVTDAGKFIFQASVGDELVVRDEVTGNEIGAVRIVAPWEGSHVTLTIGITGFIDDAPRMRRLLQRAYLQFMPRATNVIMLCSSNKEDDSDFENALLGSHIERWDTFPPRGRRVAHGRAEDGFWHDKANELSRFAGWFQFSLDDAPLQPRLWLRDADAAPGPAALLSDLFPQQTKPTLNSYHAPHD